jgi:hypothetical protein
MWIIAVALAISVIVYVPIIYALIRRVFMVLVHVGGVTSKPPPPPKDFFGLPPLPLPGWVEVFGHYFPAWMVICLWMVLPATWYAFVLCDRIQRRRRDKLGLCIECGFRLRSWRGKCPGCGVRIGPG